MPVLPGYHHVTMQKGQRSTLYKFQSVFRLMHLHSRYAYATFTAVGRGTWPCCCKMPTSSPACACVLCKQPWRDKTDKHVSSTENLLGHSACYDAASMLMHAFLWHKKLLCTTLLPATRVVRAHAGMQHESALLPHMLPPHNCSGDCARPHCASLEQVQARPSRQARNPPGGRLGALRSDTLFHAAEKGPRLPRPGRQGHHAVTLGSEQSWGAPGRGWRARSARRHAARRASCRT